eukprot:GHVO01022390.1.p1 GENE.GHVO01022390.1~~GHVO01022390.1.p1  ORF type:complete len:257 (-),score=58.99 GHVO01022390.1:91-861(-)
MTFQTCPSPTVPNDFSSNSTGEVQVLLDGLLAPREWTSDATNEKWIQNVSSEPATPMHISQMSQKIEERVKTAKEAYVSSIGTAADPDVLLSFCGSTSPLLSSTYSETISELIRQETIGCGDRGKLLARLRDESDKVIEEWDIGLQSLVSYSLRKRKRNYKVITDSKKMEDDLKRRLKCLDATRKEVLKETESIEDQHALEVELMSQQHQLAINGYMEKLSEARARYRDMMDAQDTKRLYESLGTPHALGHALGHV